MPVIDLSYAMLPFQGRCDEAIKRGSRFVMWSGGIRSGKTFSAARAFWDRLIKTPDGIFWIVVPTFKQMKGSQKMFEHGTAVEDKFTPTVPPEFYKWFCLAHNRVEKTYKFRNGAEVEYKTGERPDDFRALSVDGIWIDEGSQIIDEGYDILRGRVIDKRGFIYVSTTPRGTANWTYTKFYREMEKGNKEFFVGFGSTLENKFLPQKERDVIAKEYEGKWADQELFGKFVDFTGLIYDSFSPARGFYSALPTKPLQWFAGIDFGWEQPSGYLLIARNVENIGTPENIIMQTVYYIENEIYISQTMPEELAGIIADKEKSYNFLKILRYADNKDPRLRYGLSGGKIKIITIPAKQDKGDVLRGIRKTYDLFRQNRIRINQANCPNLINELQNYKFKEGTEVPIDKFNHLLDALRYVMFSQEGYKIEGVKRIYVPRKPMEMINI